MGSVAELFVRSLENLGAQYIFYVPGASIDPVIDVLADHGPTLIVCRHEENAALMAQAWGKITGEPGICMGTAGPGATNLVTGIATAFVEKSPVIAITGQVPTSSKFKMSHQNIDSASLFKPITKWSVEVDLADAIPEILANAYRIAMEPPEGPVHIAIPSDIFKQVTSSAPTKKISPLQLSASDPLLLNKAADLINQAQLPMLFLGRGASQPSVAHAIRAFLKSNRFPVVGTFEAGGAISRELEECFLGRVGIFYNQPGDRFIKEADLILAVGFDPTEYDPIHWNPTGKKILHIHNVPATLDKDYQLELELIGDMAKNILALSEKTKRRNLLSSPFFKELQQELTEHLEDVPTLSSSPIHPLRVIHEIRKVIQDEATVISDVGSHQYWMAQHFRCYEPRHFLTSMGFQTMGISIPWAIATSLARPGKKILSVSGDGSFLMCSMELETAVRLKIPFVHLVWSDGSYNLVKIQQEKKYGRHFGVNFNEIDTVLYAQSLGAKGKRITTAEELAPTLQWALQEKGPVILHIPIDYSHNWELLENLRSPR